MQMRYRQWLMIGIFCIGWPLSAFAHGPMDGGAGALANAFPFLIGILIGILLFLCLGPFAASKRRKGGGAIWAVLNGISLLVHAIVLAFTGYCAVSYAMAKAADKRVAPLMAGIFVLTLIIAVVQLVLTFKPREKEE